MAIKLEVAKADVVFEAGYPHPEFDLFRDGATLLDRLFKRLEPYGLRLSDLRVERGIGNVGDQHILCYLFNYLMTVRIRVERIEIICSEFPRDSVEKMKAAIVDVLRAVKDYRPDLHFRAFAVTLGLHARLQGQSVREFLARFIANSPERLGPSTGSGAVFYFGPEGDRLLSTIMLDLSAVIPDAAYFRIHGVWDAKKVTPDSVSGTADTFVQHVLDSLGLHLEACAMLTATLDPFRQLAAQRRSEVKPRPAHRSFLVRRSLLAEGQREFPPAYERVPGLVESRKFSDSEVTADLLPRQMFPVPPGEFFLRESRQPLTALHERGTIPRGPTCEPAPQEPDALPFFMAVRRFIESEQLAAARDLLSSAPGYILSDPLLMRLRSVLAPPVVMRVPERDVDRTPEYAWLRTEGSKYRGRWVALDGNNLLATAASLRELREQLKRLTLPRPPLLHRLD